MVIKIPLPWYSKSVYSPVRDEFLGGWRFAFASIRVCRLPKYQRWYWAFRLEFRIGIDAWFV